MSLRTHLRPILVVPALAAALSVPCSPARADGPNLPADSIAMTGEFVDPVCIFQHGMHGAQSRQCAMVRGRVDQGMWFYDIRRQKLYAVIGQNHWDDPHKGFLDALGDTFAIRARVWKKGGGAAIVVNAMYPPDQQPPVAARLWPWRWEWSVLLGLALLAAAYLLALTRWRARLGGSGPFERGHAAVFLLGLTTVLVALNGPLHDLSDEYLFTTHMVQHFLLGQVFPLLLILGLPPWLRRRLLRPSPLANAFHALAAVPVGAILAMLVFALWHLPPLYDVMMRVHPIHIVMHLMVMATSVLMWWPVAGGDAVRRPLSGPARMLYVFALSLPMMAVAAPLALSATPFYAWYRWAPRVWGLSPLDDQHLGGLIMWIPGSLYDWGIMSVIFFRWAARERGADVGATLVPALPAHEPLR